MTPDENVARQRFTMLQLMRLFGLGMVMLGVANLAGKLLPDLAPYFGAGFLIFGAIEFFLTPILLKRAWRQSDE